MARASSQVNIRAQIQGNITGQVAIGQNIVQIGDVHGGFVYVAEGGKTPTPRARAVPVVLRPRPATGMLDRQEEIATVVAALQGQQSTDLYGEEGGGKTTLLRRLAYEVSGEIFPDGIICLSARRHPAADLLQEFFHAFYEWDIPVKPTETQLRHALGGKRALILLDDVELAREEVDELLDIAPGCIFLLCSLERRLWGEGRALIVHGLPTDAAVELVQREMGRPLTATERPIVRQLSELVHGNPLHLLQMVALVAEGTCDLPGLVARAAAASPDASLQRAVVDSRSKAHRWLLGVLAILRGAWVRGEHLAAITQLADASAQLDSLCRQRLVEGHEGRYRLAGNLIQTFMALPDVSAWSKSALAYLVSWAEQHRGSPQQLAAQAESFLAAMELAVEGQHWSDVVRLARAIDGAFALAGWWEGWKRVVEFGLQGARALGDRSAQAWALHQLGTRALCLGEVASARQSLTEALHLWESLGDEIGAGITRNNLRLLSPSMAPPSESETPHTGPTPPRGSSPWVAVTKAAGLIVAIAVAVPATMWVMDHYQDATRRERPGAQGPAPTPMPALTIERLELQPLVLLGGAGAHGVVTISAPAPRGGIPISLATSQESVELPPSVTIEPGATSATFRITTRTLSQPIQATITAAYDQSRRTATLQVQAAPLRPILAGLSLEPSTIVGGGRALEVVTLSAPAPSDSVVTLESGAEAAPASPEPATRLTRKRVGESRPSRRVSIPQSVTVTAGSDTGRFPIVVGPTQEATSIVISAAYEGVTRTATLAIQPPEVTLNRIELSPNPVTGGDPVNGVVVLSGPAPAAGKVISLRSGDPRRATVLSQVNVQGGQTQASFLVRTSRVSATASIMIEASEGAQSLSKELTLTPAAPVIRLASFGLKPTRVGPRASAQGIVRLSEPAPPGGVRIALTSSDSALASVPATLEIPAGQTTGTFPIKTGMPSSEGSHPITITVSYGSQSLRETIDVYVLG